MYSIYDQVLIDNEYSEAGQEMEETYIKCDLTLLGHGGQLVSNFFISYNCCNCFDVTWMFYYPKLAIEKKYHSNKLKQLEASFSGCSHGKVMKAEECGIHLIYASHAGESMIPTIE